MNPAELELLVRQCTRFVGGHGLCPPRTALAGLANWVAADALPDRYGGGTLINDFEAKVAALLGHEAAVFMPSGTMAQQIAIRLWADRRGNRHVAFHPTCHLELHEEQGYRILHGLQGVLVGERDRLLTVDDLERIAEPLGALLLELPQREIGGQLPVWEELVGICRWARSRGIPLHLDGARLWECQPFYERGSAEIAGLFDSVYVSFYKGLGGLAGCMLAGRRDFIAEARIWQRRHGGNLIHLYPYVLSAHKGLEERLPRMPAYRDKAVAIARALGEIPEVMLVPNPPPTNLLHLHLRGEREPLERALLATMRASRVFMMYPLRPSSLPGCHLAELNVGDATLELGTAEIVGLFKEVFRRTAADG